MGPFRNCTMEPVDRLLLIDEYVQAYVRLIHVQNCAHACMIYRFVCKLWCQKILFELKNLTFLLSQEMMQVLRVRWLLPSFIKQINEFIKLLMLRIGFQKQGQRHQVHRFLIGRFQVLLSLLQESLKFYVLLLCQHKSNIFSCYSIVLKITYQIELDAYFTMTHRSCTYIYIQLRRDLNQHGQSACIGGARPFPPPIDP